MVHTFSPNSWEVDASESLWFQASPGGLPSEFQDSLGSVERPCLKNKTEQNNKQKPIKQR